MNGLDLPRLNGLDLFSGIGGNTLALRQYVSTVAYCEQDRHAQAVLLSRMGDGSIEPAPIWDDITTLRGDHFDVPIDIIVGGFPCQDISVAGSGAGLEGKRSGLFYEVVRLAKEIKPRFLFLENVPAIRTRGLDRVIEELTGIGYDLRWTMLSAQEVGAPHIRKRWFCLASRREALGDSDRQRHESQSRSVEPQSGAREPRQTPRLDDASEALAHAPSEQTRRVQFSKLQSNPGYGGNRRSQADWWEAEPPVGRVVDGLPRRVDRLKRLGNAVVPLQAKTAFEILMGLK